MSEIYADVTCVDGSVSRKDETALNNLRMALQSGAIGPRGRHPREREIGPALGVQMIQHINEVEMVQVDPATLVAANSSFFGSRDHDKAVA